jgi:hypothetical protein
MKENHFKISEYLVRNLVRLKKQGIQDYMEICINNQNIILKVKDEEYLINSLIDYKKVIDILSNMYRCLLVYMPKKNNQLIGDELIDTKNIDSLEYSCFKI